MKYYCINCFKTVFNALTKARAFWKFLVIKAIVQLCFDYGRVRYGD